MTDITASRQETASLATPGDFFALMKPRVMSLVVFTALVGMVLAPGALHPVIGLAALLCIAVGAGASGALNMWYDADIDAEMGRTRGRPIPRGRIRREEALAFGIVLSAFSVGIMGVLVNWLSAGLLGFTIVFYAVVYTMWLKRRTAQNIVIGGLAGAVPPMIGWAAATGSLAWEPVLLTAIIFVWTPPHFWALALAKSGDYARAGVPMLPVVAGNRATQVQILVYTVLLAVLALTPVAAGFAFWLYGAVALLGGAVFVVEAVRLWRIAPDAPDLAARGMRVFGVSIVYLFAIFLALLLEAVAVRVLA